MGRFDERMENLVPEKVQRMNQSGKEKFTRRGGQQRNGAGAFGNKRKQEEKEKLRPPAGGNCEKTSS